MLRTNEFKAALARGEPQFGLINSVPAPLLVEMLGYAGYDFVLLDLEHVGVNPETLENLIRAAGGRRELAGAGRAGLSRRRRPRDRVPGVQGPCGRS
jgi:2-keto-3-deoxy-L-rhamnonate aldolase RhmA